MRQELQSAQYDAFEKVAQGLPLLDSFIKESARLTPVESSKPAVQSNKTLSMLNTDRVAVIVSTRRHALQPFTLSDGTKLHVGDWACTPVRALMQNPEHYPKPLEFNGFRFVEQSILEQTAGATFDQVLQEEPSKLTDTYDKNNSWHVWGTGRMAWYVQFCRLIVTSADSMWCIG